MARGAVVLIEEERVALIERVREGRTYYLFPGGTIEEGETAEEAAVREAKEELGLEVRLGPLPAIVEFGESSQYYFAAVKISGIFGTGSGAEYAMRPRHRLTRAAIVRYGFRAASCQLRDCDVRPRLLAAACVEHRSGVGQVLHIHE